MQQLIENLKNTISLYVEDKENWKDTKWIKNGLFEILDTFKINCKYTKRDEVVENGYFQLANIYKALKQKDIEKVKKETNTFYNIFTLACWILTTYKK